jgi:hypothetical protein
MIKNTISLVAVALALVACGDTGGGAASGSAAAKPATSTKPAASTKVADTAKPADSAKPADTAAAAVEVAPEMKEFLDGFKGTSKDVEASLKKHAKAGLDDKDMDMYDLKEPKVIKSDKKDKQVCYDFEAAAGMTTRTYAVCWEGNKIVAVEDKGMK